MSVMGVVVDSSTDWRIRNRPSGETIYPVLCYRDDQWLDAAGSAITSGARVTERIHRVNYGTLIIGLSVDDPKAYTRPWSVTLKEDAAVDTEMVEAICAENEKDVPHLNAAPRQDR